MQHRMNQNSSRVDRLSSLPYELLSLIFQESNFRSHVTVNRLVNNGKSLEKDLDDYIYKETSIFIQLISTRFLPLGRFLKYNKISLSEDNTDLALMVKYPYLGTYVQSLELDYSQPYKKGVNHSLYFIRTRLDESSLVRKLLKYLPTLKEIRVLAHPQILLSVLRELGTTSIKIERIFWQDIDHISHNSIEQSFSENLVRTLSKFKNLQLINFFHMSSKFLPQNLIRLPTPISITKLSIMSNEIEEDFHISTFPPILRSINQFTLTSLVIDCNDTTLKSLLSNPIPSLTSLTLSYTPTHSSPLYFFIDIITLLPLLPQLLSFTLLQSLTAFAQRGSIDFDIFYPILNAISKGIQKLTTNFLYCRDFYDYNLIQLVKENRLFELKEINLWSSSERWKNFLL